MNRENRIIKRWLTFFMAALFLSGLTAMPAEAELAFLTRLFPVNTALGKWIYNVYRGVANTNADYPFIAYGYDWLAFAHFALAILFIGPFRDPIRNKWVIEFGIIACVLIIPFAFIAGHFRGIPLWWRVIDCSFGVVGLMPLIICRKKIIQLENSIKQDTQQSNFSMIA